MNKVQIRGMRSPLKLLDRWQAKARCSYTQPAAHRAWLELKPHLEPGMRMKLTIAWTHIATNGTDELDGLLREIRKSWKKKR